MKQGLRKNIEVVIRRFSNSKDVQKDILDSMTYLKAVFDLIGRVFQTPQNAIQLLVLGANTVYIKGRKFKFQKCLGLDTTPLSGFPDFYKSNPCHGLALKSVSLRNTEN